jgi:hypothetical protein
MIPRFPTEISWAIKPKEFTTKTDFPVDDTSMENLPSVLVTAPLFVPFKVMLAPAIGAPFSPFTVPSTFLVCDQTALQRLKISAESMMTFLIMAVLMNTFWVLTNAYLGIFAFMNVAKRLTKTFKPMDFIRKRFR